MSTIKKLIGLLGSVKRNVKECKDLPLDNNAITSKLISLQNTTDDLIKVALDVQHKQGIALISKLSDLSYKRFPQEHAYKTDDDVNEFFSKLVQVSKLQVGDFVTPREQYLRGYDVQFVGRDGMLDDPIGCGNGYIGVPAWVFELGMKHGHSFAKLQAFYAKTNAAFLIYPKSMQGNKLQVDKQGYIQSALGYDFINKTKFDMSEGDDYFDDLNYLYKYTSVFLEDSPDSPDSPDKPSKSKKIPKSKASPNKCIEQTTKKYTDRPSPPFPASDCPGMVKKGNNDKLYESVANVKGIFSWKLKK